MNIFYKAKHILLADEEDVQYIKKEIESGKSFEELAQEFSECDSASKGGNLGRFPQGTMVAEFERALYHMKPGEIKYNVKTKFGHHIIYRIE